MTNPTAPAPSGGGMPKWLIILLVVLVVVIFGCCGGISTCIYFTGRAFKKGAAAAPAFIQDQMKKQGVEINTADAAGNIAMPSNFPADIPVYSGMKTTSSVAEIPKEAGQITFTSPASAADIKTFYDKQMIDNGWTQENTNSSADASQTTYSKNNHTASVSINPDGSTSNVIILYGKK